MIWEYLYQRQKTAEGLCLCRRCQKMPGGRDECTSQQAGVQRNFSGCFGKIHKITDNQGEQ